MWARASTSSSAAARDAESAGGGDSLSDVTASRSLPTGTVTFLFTDIEGSTRLLHELGAEGYAAALAEHRRVLREAFVAHGGVEVDTQGDAFFVAFSTAAGALAAAAEATEALAGGPIRVRMGVHTGTPYASEEGYVGPDVHRAARIAAAAHGGQVVVSAATAALADGAPLRDLGEHRFKDLAAAERVFQVGQEEFPQLRSLYRTNLPVPATSFVGRAAEVAAVAELVRTDAVRLVTLTGPGGTGKTRLALQAAAEAAESFPDGLTWLPLAPLADAALVAPALGAALELAETLDGAGMDGIARALAGKRAAIVVNNAEHLLPGLADELATLLEVTGPTLVVTSRERLGLPGEHVVPVDPLADDEAVVLFEERAGALGVRSADRDSVGALCRRLDNLPLAVELAAGRASLFTPAQLLERLSARLDLLKGGRRADPRQQTLRATIEWSHGLLDADEQALLRRLAVFAGGSTYDAAESVCGGDPDIVQSLLEKSLIRRRDAPSGPRLWMLETIREYALERLEESGDSARVAVAHAEWFRAWAPAYARRLRSYDREAQAAMTDELPNVRAALDHAFARADLRLAGDLMFGAFFYWLSHGHGREAEAAARRWLTLDRASSQPIERAPGLFAAGEIMRFAGDPRTAAVLKQEQVEIVRADPDGEAHGWPFRSALPALLSDLASMEVDWDLAAAAAHADEALALRRGLGEPAGAAHALAAVANVAFARRDFEGARRALVEAVELWRSAGADAEIPSAVAASAECLLHLGRIDEARPLLVESLEGTQAGTDLPQLLYALRIAALHAALAGRDELAATLIAATDSALDEGGVRIRADRELELERELLAGACDVAAPTWRAGLARGRELGVDEAVEAAAAYLTNA